MFDNYIFAVCVCVYIGNPVPNITWVKDGVTPLQRQLGIVRYTQWAIVLEDLVVMDSGNYTCYVCNHYGCIDFTYKVDIIGKPRLFYRIYLLIIQCKYKYMIRFFNEISKLTLRI